jgi:hypothetical protein
MKLRRAGKGLNGKYAMSASVPEVPSNPQTIGEWIGVVFVLAMFGIVGAIGLLTLTSAIGQLASGETPLPVALLLIVLGLVFTAIGVGFFYSRYVKKPLWDAQKTRTEALYPNQPWMLRRDWAARRVVHSNLGLTIFLWIWAAGWWGALAFIGTVNRQKIEAALETSWWNHALLALFVLCGVAGLRLAIAAAWDYWRYGRTVLRLDTLPAHPGDQFRGAIEARLAQRPTAPLKAALTCEELRWVEYRSGGKTTSKLSVKELARLDREIAASQILMSRSGARIPVEIDLPEAILESSLDDEGNGIRWTLRVEGLKANPPFSCAFEIPVYARRP